NSELNKDVSNKSQSQCATDSLQTHEDESNELDLDLYEECQPSIFKELSTPLPNQDKEPSLMNSTLEVRLRIWLEELKLLPNSKLTNDNFQQLLEKCKLMFNEFCHTFNKDLKNLAKDYIKNSSNDNRDYLNKSILNRYIDRDVSKNILNKYFTNTGELELTKTTQDALRKFVQAAFKLHATHIHKEDRHEFSLYKQVLKDIKSLNSITLSLDIPTCGKSDILRSYSDFNVAEVEIDNTSQNLLEDSFTIQYHLAYSYNDYQKNNNQDDQQEDYQLEDDNQQKDNKPGDIFEEPKNKINVIGFILEIPTNQLPKNLENVFNPYFANFTEMYFFIWVKRLIECILNLFNNEGNNAFLKIWKSIELPKFWSKLPNPITHQKSFMMLDSFYLAMLMPHILNRFLKIQHIKESMITNLVDTTKCQHRDQIFPKSFLHLPNLHTNMHLIVNAKNYKTLVNTACGVKKAIHGLFKNFVLHTNKKNIDLDLLRHYNTLQALHFWLDHGQDECVPDPSYYTNCSLLKQLLSGWYITKSPDQIINLEYEDIEKLWKNVKIQKRGFGGWNFNKDNNNLDLDLYQAYCEEFKMFAALNTYKISFFDYISYIVVEDNDNSSAEHNTASCYIKVQVGNVVKLREISDTDDNLFISFAL
ncbi:22350_t:CDS:10, partial [Dentiscutata erythropus]